MSILDELYEWYEMKAACHPERREAEKRFGEAWRRAEALMGEERTEELRNRVFEYMDDECRQDFQAGFRLGALLMQELHTPAPWSDHNPSRA